jgi:hypothetical protein
LKKNRRTEEKADLLYGIARTTTVARRQKVEEWLESNCKSTSATTTTYEPRPEKKK